MSRDTKFGLLLVCVLTSVFGVLVYKRMHKPADLVAGTDHDPAAVAVSDNYPIGAPTEPIPSTTEPPPGLDPASANNLLAIAPNPTRPQAAPVTSPIPTDDSDPFAPSTKVVQVAPTKPPANRLPTDLDEEFFSAPASTARVGAAATPLEAAPSQSEPDPFAGEPAVAAQPVRATPVETPPARSLPPAQEPEFDPFAAAPAIAAPSAGKAALTLPAETEADPFAQEPPQTEPVTTSSRSTAVMPDPAPDVRTFESEPVTEVNPPPGITVPAAESFDVTLQSIPVNLPTPKQPSMPPAVVIDYPETKTVTTNSDPLLVDPLDSPPARVTTPAPTSINRQPQALPVESVDIDFPAQSTIPQSPPRGIDLDFNPAPVAERSATQGYVVEPGDNYWTISKKLYGTGKYFQALATHNAPLVADPAKLKPGQRIAAPSATELDARYAALLASTGSNGASKTVQSVGFFVSEAGQPMYRVGSNDTLSGIAFVHLGRASRWVQIYELNRHVLKDGNTLKVGAELRLPADASQVQTTGGAGVRR